jgi:hypothetical protein
VNIFTANDTVISPIVENLATIIENQISPAPSTVYRQPPDRAPEDNTTTIILAQYKILDSTNWKLEARLIFNIQHWFRPLPHFSDALLKCYSYLMPYLLAFQDQTNQENANWRIVEAVQGGIKTEGVAAEARVGLTTNVSVLTEFNIPLINP